MAHGPGNLRFDGLNITQEEDFPCRINADDKLVALEKRPISRLRRRETESELIAVAKSAFISLNSSLGGLGIAASPFCTFYASPMHQMLPSAKVSVLASQADALRILKNLGTNISFPKPVTGAHELCIEIFVAKGRLSEHGQISYLSGLLIGSLVLNLVFHTISWMYHKSNPPYKVYRSSRDPSCFRNY